MKCLLTYKLSLSLFSPEITFENTNFSIISRETKTEIMCLSLSMSLRIFVNPGPGFHVSNKTTFSCQKTNLDFVLKKCISMPGSFFNTKSTCF